MAGKSERGDWRLGAARYRIERMSRDDDSADVAQTPGTEPGAEPGSDGASDTDPTGDAGQSMMDERAHYVEIAIQQSIRRGDFDNLPGAGKPLADLEHNDPDWWIRRKIERENITGLGPPALTLRTEDAELDARLDACHTPQAVRVLLDDFNTRVIEARRQLLGGPPVVTAVRDVDEELQRWMQRREARRASTSSSEVAASSAAPRTRSTAAGRISRLLAIPFRGRNRGTG